MSQALLADDSAYLRDLMAFLDASPTPFHAVSAMRQRLMDAGFIALQEGAAWDLEPEKHYLVTRGGGLIAFSGSVLGATPDQGLRGFGAHTDSPNLRVRPNPSFEQHGYLQLGLDCYGGLQMAPWFDRDLGLAGRVVAQTADGELRSWLLRWSQPMALIPSLAIHLDRECNSNRSINAQKELVAVMATDQEESDWDELLRTQIHLEHGDVVRQIHGWDLSLYDCQPAALLGLRGEFLSSARLDNLLSCHAGTLGLIAALQNQEQKPCFLVCNDHEEVGSMSSEGASGPFLEDVLQRLLPADAGLRSRLLRRALLCSADNAHGLHPNYADKHESRHAPLLNGGPVLKINSNQRYATQPPGLAVIEQLAEKLDIPLQYFVTRADLGCGSTIGPLTATRLGLQTVDLGVPQWAMHSIRESCGSSDPVRLARLACGLYSLDARALAQLADMQQS